MSTIAWTGDTATTIGIAMATELRHTCERFRRRRRRRALAVDALDVAAWVDERPRIETRQRTRRRAVTLVMRTMSAVGWRDRGAEAMGCGRPVRAAFSIANKARTSARPSSPSASGGIPAMMQSEK